jgi:ribosomal protein S9
MEEQQHLILDGENYLVSDIPQLGVDLIIKIKRANDALGQMSATMEAIARGVKDMESDMRKLLPEPMAKDSGDEPAAE